MMRLSSSSRQTAPVASVENVESVFSCITSTTTTKTAARTIWQLSASIVTTLRRSTGDLGADSMRLRFGRYRDDWHGRVRTRRDAADRLAAELMAGVPRVVEAGDALQFVISDSVTVSEAVGASAGTSTATGVAAKRPSISLNDYLKTLPALRHRAYAQARLDWDSGVTARMVDATYRIIDVLQDVLAVLATCYPHGHFDRQEPKDYIAELIATRFGWHRYRHEPEGEGQNGTIVHTLVAGSVLADVEQMVVEMVGSVTLDWSAPAGDAAGFDFEAWQRAWARGDHIDHRGLRTPARRLP